MQELDIEHPPVEGAEEETGFTENARAAWRVTIDEDLSISEYLHQGAYRDRNNVIDQGIRDGSIPKGDYEPYVSGDEIDYPKMAYDLKRKGHAIQDDYDVRGNIRENLANQRQAAEDIHSRSSGMGALGTFAGSMAAVTLDPINMGAMAIPGVGMARGATLMARAGKAALYYGTASVATEQYIQFGHVQPWKEKIGVNYTATDALTNIALAGVGSAVLGAGVEVGGHFIKQGFRNIKDNVRAKEPPHVAEPIIKELEMAEAEYDAAVQTHRQSTMETMADNTRLQLEYYNELASQMDAPDEALGRIIDTLEDDADFFQRLEDQGIAPKLDEPTDMSLERDIRKSEKQLEQYAAARELGYDTDHPMYRGAPHEGVLHNDEMFLSEDPSYAAMYAEGYEGDGTLTTGGDVPVKREDLAPVMGKFFIKTAELYSFNDSPDLLEEFRTWLYLHYADKDPSPGEFEADLTFDNELPWQLGGDARMFLDEIHPGWKGIIFQEGPDQGLKDISYMMKKDAIAPVWTDFKAELAASNKRMGEDQAKWLDEQMQKMRDEADMLRKNPQVKFERMKEHNTRMREDPVYKIDTAIKQLMKEGDLPMMGAEVHIHRHLDKLDDAGVKELADRPLEDLKDELRRIVDDAVAADKAFYQSIMDKENGVRVPPKLSLVPKDFTMDEPTPIKNERPDSPSGLDAEHDTVAKQLDELNKREEAKKTDDTVPDMFADFDEDKFANMTEAERDAMVAKLLGEEGIDEASFGSQEIEYETGQLDADGNMIYQSKTADEIYDELDEASNSLDDFLDCWTSPDAEE